jgi:hypothetical protein
MSNVNILAAIVAALSSFALGGLWYSTPVFGAGWRRAAGGPEIQGHPGRRSSGSASCSLSSRRSSMRCSFRSRRAPRWPWRAGVVAASFGINYQFANRRTILWLIDGGYHSVQFAIYGVTLGRWR